MRGPAAAPNSTQQLEPRRRPGAFAPTGSVRPNPTQPNSKTRRESTYTYAYTHTHFDTPCACRSTQRARARASPRPRQPPVAAVPLRCVRRPRRPLPRPGCRRTSRRCHPGGQSRAGAWRWPGLLGHPSPVRRRWFSFSVQWTETEGQADRQADKTRQTDRQARRERAGGERNGKLSQEKRVKLSAKKQRHRRG